MSDLDRGELAVLAADLDRILIALKDAHDRLVNELDDGRVPHGRHQLAFVAITLAHYYNAFEDGLQRVARCFERVLPEGPMWHAELLRRATLALPGLRPAVVATEAFDDARALMRFRHFLHHAYGIRLSAPKIQLPMDALMRVHAPLTQGLIEVRRFIDRVLA